MKSIILILALSLIGSLNTFCQEDKMATSAELQEWIAKDKNTTRANLNDQVLIVLVTIKDESKQAFDAWVKDVLYDALYNSDSEMKKAQLKTTRWLEPARQNKDNTWTYSWIMDPVIPNTNYDIPRFLDLEYGVELGKKHWDKYLTFMAAPPQSILLNQTDY